MPSASPTIIEPNKTRFISIPKTSIIRRRLFDEDFISNRSHLKDVSKPSLNLSLIMAFLIIILYNGSKNFISSQASIQVLPCPADLMNF